MNIVTAPLFAAAYPKCKQHTCLTHAVVLSESGDPIKVLCGSVRIEHVMDDSTQHTSATPSCKRCAAKLTKLRAITK